MNTTIIAESAVLAAAYLTDRHLPAVLKMRASRNKSQAARVPDQPSPAPPVPPGLPPLVPRLEAPPVADTVPLTMETLAEAARVFGRTGGKARAATAVRNGGKFARPDGGNRATDAANGSGP